MQKLIAILFVLLLCSTTVMQAAYLPVAAVEQLADSDKSKEVKPEKKEGKEFLTACVKKMHTIQVTILYYCNHLCYGLPQPVPNITTPPPDVIC